MKRNAETELQRIERELADLKENVNKANGEVGRVRAESAAIEGRLQGISNELVAEKKRASALEDEKARLQAELRAANDKLRGAADKLRELETSARQNEGERAKRMEAEAKVDALTARLRELEGKLQSQEKILSKIQADAARIRDLEAELTELRERLRTASLELEFFKTAPDPCGIGAKIVEDGKSMQIDALVENMAALRSGAIKVGDHVLAVDEHDTTGMSVARVRQLIAGKRGSYVNIRLSRAGQEFEASLRRGSFGPEHHVVSPERQDMAAPKSTSF